MIRRPPRSTLFSLHDALPISSNPASSCARGRLTKTWLSSVPPAITTPATVNTSERSVKRRDRKSTRLNSSHSQISYAVFCLKKKKKTQKTQEQVIEIKTRHKR